MMIWLEPIAIIATWYPHFRGANLDNDLNQLELAIAGSNSTGIFLRDFLIDLWSQIAASMTDNKNKVANKEQM